jgi:hypothetical protein
MKRKKRKKRKKKRKETSFFYKNIIGITPPKDCKKHWGV